MNLMGKIFTFLILFMSIAFLAVAVMVGASHREWKLIAQENKEKADRYSRLLNEAKKSSNDQVKLLEAEKVARASQIAQLESQLVVFKASLADNNGLLQKAQQDSTSFMEKMDEAEKRLALQDADVTRLREENRNYANDVTQQRVSVVNLTNKLNETDALRQQIELLLQDLTTQVTKQEKVMNAYGLRDDELTSHIAPELDGAVVRTENNIIVISLGTDDGLRKGHELDIYRGGRFVGKATVTREDFNLSAAVLQKEYQNMPVQEGDYVTTKF